jgi:hypothetical protein
LKSEELRELQVSQHSHQQAYYAALKTRMEMNVATQLYHNIIAYRGAQRQIETLDGQVLPELAKAREKNQRQIDQARMARHEAELERAHAQASLNTLLGRPVDTPLVITIDEQQALKELAVLMKEKDVVATERAIMDARIGVARSVSEMIDKNMKVDVLQLEPVSLIVRAFGRLVGALSSNLSNNPDDAMAARINVLNEERAQAAFDGRRHSDIVRLRSQLQSANNALSALLDKSDPRSLLERNRLSGVIHSLEAQLISKGEDSSAGLTSNVILPNSWEQLKRSLVDAEQSLTASPGEMAPVVPTPELKTPRSGVYARGYFARQTLGHQKN